jgi:hypothetical protein
VLPGVWTNIGKRGVTSFTFGRRGLRYTIGRRHARATVGLPGSGIFVTETEPRRRGDLGDRIVYLLLWIFALRSGSLSPGCLALNP